MSIIESTPVPVTPPAVPPRPPLWVVIEPPEHKNRRGEWIWCGYFDTYDNEDDAQEYANEHPGSVIFRLPGSGEVAK